MLANHGHPQTMASVCRKHTHLQGLLPENMGSKRVFVNSVSLTNLKNITEYQCTFKDRIATVTWEGPVPVATPILQAIALLLSGESAYDLWQKSQTPWVMEKKPSASMALTLVDDAKTHSLEIVSEGDQNRFRALESYTRQSTFLEERRARDPLVFLTLGYGPWRAPFPRETNVFAFRRFENPYAESVGHLIHWDPIRTLHHALWDRRYFSEKGHLYAPILERITGHRFTRLELVAGNPFTQYQDQEYYFEDQTGEERSLSEMPIPPLLGDILHRIWLLNPNVPDPFALSGLILIDGILELEKDLYNLFPNCQFIVSPPPSVHVMI